ncbi:MAG TPA: sugar transporter [Geobacter sp.]|nr:sugar transporter [Geobacter sp.]
MKVLKVALLAVLTLIAGCHSSATHKVESELRSPEHPGEYRIQPGDQIDVKFFYNPELNESLTVRSDGRITLQLVNDVLAAGLSPTELTATLTKAYMAELSNPKVAVIVKTPISQKVYVDGEVYRAGLVNLTGPTTALQSIAQSGGMKDTARPEEVIVLRRVEGSVQAIRINLKNVMRGRDSTQDIFLIPNDIVYVPKSAIANINVWIDTYVRKNVPLPVGIGYDLNRN